MPVPWWLRLSPLWIVLAVVAVYIKVLSFDFTGLDDLEILKERYFIIGHLSNIKLAFTTDAFLGTTGTFYRPLQTASFMVDAFIGGPRPLIYHLTNLLLHGSASLCVFWLLLTLGYRRLLGLAMGLSFALHPLFVLMVGWVPTRGDLLLTIFAVLAFALFLKSFRSAHSRWLVFAHGASFFLAFLSKETAVALPALCVAFYWFELRRNPKRKLIYPYFVVWGIAGGVWYQLHSCLHPGQLPGDNLGFSAFLKNLRIFPELLGKFFVPFKFQLVPLFTTMDTAIGLVTAVLLVWLIIRTKQWRNKRIQWGCLWFVLFILPVLVFRNSDAEYLFDYLYHRAYLPAVGLIIVVAELLARVPVWDDKVVRRVAYVSVPLLAYFGLASFYDLGFYHDSIRFFTEAIARTPTNALCHNNRGAYYGNMRREQETALKDFNDAIAIFPHYLTAILNRGITYQNLGKQNEAIADLETGLKLSPNDPETILRLADLRYLLNDFGGALADYNRLLAMEKMYPRIYSKKAGSEVMLGWGPEALRDANHALELDAKDEEAYNSRGLVNRLMGKLEQARSDFDEATTIRTNYSRPFNNRATIYLAQGDPQRALQDLDKAIEFDPAFAEAFSNRGSIKHQLGQNESALKDLDEALRLNPHFADAYQNRGVVKNVLKRFPEALEDFNQALKLQPRNGGAYLGRGIAKLYLEDKKGACEDWKESAALGVKDATTMLGEYCK